MACRAGTLTRMTIWILGGGLVALAAAFGYLMGAVRSTVSLVGAITAAYLAKPVGAMVAGLVPLMGFTNPIWSFYMPPLIGFVLVSFVFLVVSLVAHYLVQRRYRNNTDEYTYARWERLVKRTGVAVGAAVGLVWFVLAATVAYVPGYLVAQLADTEESATGFRLMNSVTHDAQSTGLTRLIERIQPASDEHYLAADILGLVYHNPALHSRLASYPPFLGMAEKDEIQQLGKDPEVQSLIQSKAGLQQVLEHSRIQAVTQSPELVAELLALNLKDLSGYLRTGVSEQFKDEHLLGRWRLNVRRSIAEMKLVGSAKLPASEFNLLRKALNVYLEDLTIGFTTDNKALLKVKAKDEAKLMQTVGRSPAPANAGGGSGGGGADGGGGAGTGPGLTPGSIAARAIPQQPDQGELMRQRYGLSGPGRPGAPGGGAGAGPTAPTLANTSGVLPVRTASKAPTSTPLGAMMSTGEGTWAKAGDKYRLTFSRDGKEVALEATVKESSLVAVVDGRTLVFDRI